MVSKDLIAGLPTTGGYSSLLALVPGIVGGTRDVQAGPCACTFSSHGALLAGRANEEGRTLLDGLLMVAAATSLMSYALYTIWPATVAKFGTEALLYTVPIVAYGIFRYLYLTRASEKSEDPSQVLLTDRPMGITVLLYLVVVVLVLYGR